MNKTIALKIFKLGYTKYGHIPEYVLAYLDYMSHLNGKLRNKSINRNEIIFFFFRG